MHLRCFAYKAVTTCIEKKKKNPPNNRFGRNAFYSPTAYLALDGLLRHAVARNA